MTGVETPRVFIYESLLSGFLEDQADGRLRSGTVRCMLCPIWCYWTSTASNTAWSWVYGRAAARTLRLKLSGFTQQCVSSFFRLRYFSIWSSSPWISAGLSEVHWSGVPSVVVGTRMSVLTVVSVMSFDDMTRSG